jgi:hypothetical protein
MIQISNFGGMKVPKKISYYPEGMDKPKRYLALNRRDQLIGTT